MTKSATVPANEWTPLVGQHALSLCARAVHGISIAMLFILVSTSMIFSNKALMAEDRFPFPVFLVTLHMAGSLTMSMLLRSIAPFLFPSAPSVFDQQEELPSVTSDKEKFRKPLAVLRALTPFVPIAFCGTLCLVLGNWAYKVATVSCLQMIKESHIVIVYVLSLVAGVEQLKLRNAMVLFFVAVCATLAVSAQTSLSLTGLLLQMVAGFFGSSQLVLTNVMLSMTGRGKIDPMTMVLCTAPLMLAFLVPANYLMWNAMIIERLSEHRRFIICNVFLAFLMQVTSVVTIHSLSATGLSLASVAKDLGIVLAASQILGEHLSGLQVLGFTGSVLFIGLYSAMKLFL